MKIQEFGSEIQKGRGIAKFSWKGQSPVPSLFVVLGFGIYLLIYSFIFHIYLMYLFFCSFVSSFYFQVCFYVRWHWVDCFDVWKLFNLCNCEILEGKFLEKKKKKNALLCTDFCRAKGTINAYSVLCCFCSEIKI